MRPGFIIFHLLLLTTISAAQKIRTGEVNFYAFDQNWKPCDAEMAKYLGCLEKLNDSCYQWKYYHFEGPLISIETYRDPDAAVPHGYFAFFDANGNLDSAGTVFEGRRHEKWHYYTDTFSVWQVLEYEKGILIKKKDHTELEAERKRNEAEPLWPDDKEAVFKGGLKAWLKYLEKNLVYPDRALQLQKSGQVRILFTVNSDGSLTDLKIQRSVEYSLDNEALRLIRRSPKWEPAFQDGRKVKAYRVQPLTFAGH